MTGVQTCALPISLTIDPHTAVGIGVANKISLKENMIVLGTAHPAKFSNVIMKETGKKPELPDNLKKILEQKEKYVELPKDLEKVKKYILDNVQFIN